MAKRVSVDKNVDLRLNVFKVCYQWYEGDNGETRLCKIVSREEFENDLIEARNFAEKLMGVEIKDRLYLGKGYSVQCLPEYYEQIIWFLTEKKKYVECFLDLDIEYFIDDSCSGKRINIQKRIQKVCWEKVDTKKCRDKDAKRNN